MVFHIKKVLHRRITIFKRFSTTVCNKPNPVVTTKQGKLRGCVGNLYDGSIYYSFKGIPYAKPPVGSLRFKDPIPHQGWQGVHDATKHGGICPQFDLQHTVKEGNEDCLFLNVYTTSLQPDSKIPVIVFLHGGGFMSGSGNSNVYGPKFLLKHGVILVTLNFRLTTLGFLSLDTPEVPGNAGLKDQIVALRWVKDNIGQFGGDPDNVTIFGESAGAAMVTYHLLSPMADGLFHKAIAQSGDCLSDWALAKNVKARAFKIGKVLGKETDDTNELLQFLQSVEPTKLVEQTLIRLNEDEKYRGLPMYFAPVVEKKGSAAFLDDEPLNLLKAGKCKKVPLIVGYNSLEGIITAKMILRQIKVYDKKPSYFVPQELVNKLTKEKLEEFGDRIKKFYCKDKDLTANDFVIISKMMTDIHFIIGLHRFSDLYLPIHSSLYMYRFNCMSELNFLKFLSGATQYDGACHSDQLFYTFNNPMNEENYEKHESLQQLVDMVTKLWANFAKSGNPTPDNTSVEKWLPYTKKSRHCLNIEPKLSMGCGVELERLEFWKELYEEAGAPIL